MGHKPCFLCRGVTNHAIPNRPLHLACRDAIPLTDFEIEKLLAYTDEDLTETLQRLDSHREAWCMGVGAIETITHHQLWELGKPLLDRLNTTKPNAKMLDVPRELFPVVSDDVVELKGVTGDTPWPQAQKR